MVTTAPPATPLERLAARPRAMAVLGALTIMWSSILMRLADVAPSTAAVFRCGYALPVLVVVARAEDRRLGVRPRRTRWAAAAAGVLFAADLIFWDYAIQDVGAGLATVMANLQVLLVPLIAWAVLGERPGRRLLALLPLMLAGILLISGALESGAYGDRPAQGVAFGVATGLTYAGFILLLRSSGADLRRPAGPLLDATAVATVAAILAGLAIGDLDVVPSWPAHGWLLLLALSAQVVGWLLISATLPRLPAAITSLLLTIQPVGSVVLAAVIFGEHPSALQLCGVVAILAGLVLATRRRAASLRGSEGLP
ncbi:DMT family transporter [Baekduia soli]|uniref:DMT family transporter n=1 Tax=Baekduia soli TaxID=496014 RepID=UPI001651F0E9|nr:DMT family transporter [Baekduia soli]